MQAAIGTQYGLSDRLMAERLGNPGKKRLKSTARRQKVKGQRFGLVYCDSKHGIRVSLTLMEALLRPSLLRSFYPCLQIFQSPPYHILLESCVRGIWT